MEDEQVLTDIASVANLKESDMAIEVGPGTGALTKHLIRSGAILTAVEKDERLFDELKREYAEVC